MSKINHFSYFGPIVQHIWTKSNPYTRFVLISAMIESLKLDFDSIPPKPESSLSIRSKLGITLKFLHQNQIIINRNQALQFLKILGVEINKLKFFKLTTKKQYEKVFNRPLGKFGNNYLYTYAEIQHLIRYGKQINLPFNLNNAENFLNKKYGSKSIVENVPTIVMSSRKSLVFLCHAHEDKNIVEKYYDILKGENMAPWMDSKDLLGGMLWENEIPKVIGKSDFILVFVSKYSINKDGFVQNEIKFALERALKKPFGTIFVIPVRLDNSKVPALLSQYHYIDLYRKDGMEKLLNTLNHTLLPS